MSEVKVNKISPRSGTTITLGDSGDTFTVPSGVTFDASSGGLAGTLTTAAQPNITSVGTLTSLTVEEGGRIKLDGSSPKGGFFNTALGELALRAMGTSSTGTNNYNTAIGYATLRNLTGGGQNTAIGNLALNSLTGIAGNNTAVGYEAGKFISSGQNNTILGSFDGNENGLDIRTSSGNVVISDGNGQIRFYANSSGNVGIGTTSPSNLLHLTGPQNGTALQIANTTNTNGIRINSGVSGLSSDSLQFLNVNGDSLLIIDGSNKSTIVGNIGPSGYRASFGDFEVKNLDSADGSGGTLVLSNTDGSILSNQILGNLTFASYDQSGASTTGGVASIRAVASEIYSSTSGANLLFLTHSSIANNGTVNGNMSERMRITSSGNVGIGISSPSYKLDLYSNSARLAKSNVFLQKEVTVSNGQTKTIDIATTGSYFKVILTGIYASNAGLFTVHEYEKVYVNSVSAGGNSAISTVFSQNGGNFQFQSGDFAISRPGSGVVRIVYTVNGSNNGDILLNVNVIGLGGRDAPSAITIT